MFGWNRIADPQSGFLYELSESSLALGLMRNPTYMPALDDSHLVIGSDYSGQHSGARYEAYSFLVTTSKSISHWIELNSEFRSKFLQDGRRMSFKRLNDKQRWISIEYFLENANNIVGTTFTFLVDRRISTISGTKIDEIVNIYSDCFNDGISNATAEKMFRGASFVALLLAGLKKEKQSTYWISDNDEILDTFDRREGFGKLVSYFTFGLTHWKAPADCHFTTTGNRMAPDWGEDFCAIPDLVAGTLSNFAHELPFRQGRSNWETILSRKVERDPRVRVIGDWMALQEGQLRHVVFTLEKGFGASAFYFAGATAKNPYRGSFLL